MLRTAEVERDAGVPEEAITRLTAQEQPVGVKEPLHQRYDWLDQSRGFIGVLLAISVLTWPLSGNVITGEPVVGPTFLNHGFCYVKAEPALLTLIDAGQQVFMFLIGFTGYIAFTSRLRKRGGRSAFFYAFRRVAALYLLAAVSDGLIPFLTDGHCDWHSLIYRATFANLAIGSFAAYVAIALFRDANSRLRLAALIALVHAVLFALPLFNHYTSDDSVLGLPLFPFISVNHATLAIVGTCFAQWIRDGRDDLDAVFRSRILPAVLLSLIGCYCVDWLQPAEHHDVNLSLVFLSVAFAGLLLSCFYCFGRIGYRIPVLTEYGRNLLLMFILTFFVGDMYARLFSKPFLLAYPVVAMILVGVLPLAVLAGIALFLDKKNIVFRL
ncbi:MAG: hypothetical protein JXR94_19220 [Candidatus Hydrogenedentes bacterium]|nr:hypothetical protein [Candidatus Hydrogenedentota bacterium]